MKRSNESIGVKHPNPLVYRVAAQLVSERGGYSCLAIGHATTLLRVGSWAQRDKYVEQYTGMFGEFDPNKPITSRAISYGRTRITGSHLSERHPFWNLSDTPATRGARVIALLLMAAIVENPIRIQSNLRLD